MLLWLWKMAWRESRGSRRRLVLAMLAMSVGLAACLAITVFEANVRLAVHEQAKILLGADLVLSSRQPFTPEAEIFLASLGGEQTREIRCNSMAYFPKSGASRLVQIRALDGPFPYYGTLETEPPGVLQTLQTDLQAVADAGLLLQMAAQPGDPVTIGTLTFSIAGRLHKIPGEAMVATLFSPRVYLSMAALQQAGLLQKGSIVTYKAYVKLPPEVDADSLVETHRAELGTHRLSADTVRKRTAGLGRLTSNFAHFLSLVGFMALVLGGIGVASAMHVYITTKRTTVAVLRCLGARPWQTLAVYVVQAALLGSLGALLGAACGLAVQAYLPLLLRDFLPVSLPTTVVWPALLRGLGLGFVLVLLFALLPLVAVRRIPPLLALRAVYADTPVGRRDPWRWGILLLLAGLSGAFALTQTEHWGYGLGFCAGLGVALGLLAGVARLLMALVRHAMPTGWAYVWRQGLLNLYRPNNQTLVLIVALGLGTFLLVTLYLAQHMLLRQMSLSEVARQPNLIIFDVQSDQRQAVEALVQSHGLPVLQQVPLVTMRLASINTKTVQELHADPGYKRAEWALLWEYRATYREHLLDTERLAAGHWQGQVDSAEPVVPISLETDIARTLGVGLGDRLEFDVQGVPLTTRVTSLRRVEWQRLQPNVYVLFPAGVLEAAPQFVVLLTRAATPELSASVQRALVQHFPNVSVIDLTALVQTIAAMVQKMALAIRFMVWLSLAAGLLVLASAVVTSRAQRRHESVLLRTLGASRRQIQQIVLLEYLFLGGFAALSGLLLALMASWVLATWVFETTYVVPGLPILTAFVLVLALTVVTGLLGSRGVTTQAPLVILQHEQ